jgi:hypothetical protein
LISNTLKYAQLIKVKDDEFVSKAAKQLAKLVPRHKRHGIASQSSGLKESRFSRQVSPDTVGGIAAPGVGFEPPPQW